MEYFQRFTSSALLVLFLANVFLSVGTSEKRTLESDSQVRVVRSGNSHLLTRAGQNGDGQVRVVRSGSTNGHALESGADAESDQQLVRVTRGNGMRPVRQAHAGGITCQCTCDGLPIDADAGSGAKMGGGGGGGGAGRSEVDEIDNTGIPGWGSSSNKCKKSWNGCVTNRPLTAAEFERYATDLDWFLYGDTPGKK